MRLLSHSGIWVFFGVMGLAFLAGCRPTFPLCRHNEDCATEPGSVLAVCASGKCQECAQPGDCPSGRKQCLQGRCLECALHEDCPPERPVCQDVQCVRECDTEADCAGRGKLDRVCLANHCQRECEKDSDCERAMECKNTHCIPRCHCQSDQDCLEGKTCQNCVCAGTGS